MARLETDEARPLQLRWQFKINRAASLEGRLWQSFLGKIAVYALRVDCQSRGQFGHAALG